MLRRGARTQEPASRYNYNLGWLFFDANSIKLHREITEEKLWVENVFSLPDKTQMYSMQDAAALFVLPLAEIDARRLSKSNMSQQMACNLNFAILIQLKLISLPELEIFVTGSGKSQPEKLSLRHKRASIIHVNEKLLL
jgi:hypothetical protein